MSSVQKQVIEFHEAFDHPTLDRPTVPPDARVRFRIRLIVEELFEAMEAVGMGVSRDLRSDFTYIIDESQIHVDLPELADALADIDYVVEGTRQELGINGGPVADEVHRSNMAKQFVCESTGGCGGCGDDHMGGKCLKCKGTGRVTKKRPDGKTIKPPGWKPPDIAGVLEAQRHGVGCLEHIRYESLLERTRKLPPMTEQQKAEQRLDWVYGNLAIDGKANRDAFKQLAMSTIDGHERGCGWTEEQFDTWAKDKEWSS